MLGGFNKEIEQRDCGNMGIAEVCCYNRNIIKIENSINYTEGMK